MSAQVPLVLVLFASQDIVCPLVEGKSKRKPFTTWTNPAKQMKNSHRASANPRRSSLRRSTRPKSSVQRSCLRKSSPPRRSSFPRSSFPSSFPRCWCRRSAPLRSAFQVRTCSRRTLPWSSLLAEWENTSWKKEALRKGWLALARNLKGTYMAEI